MLIQDRLKDKDGFSEAEKSIAAYFLSRQLSLEGESVRHVASSTFTSPATVMRFCQRLGFEGYADFREAYLKENSYLSSHFQDINANRPFLEKGSPMAVAGKLSALYSETVQDTLALLISKELEAAVKLLDKAQNIYIASGGVYSDLASAFRENMSKIGKTVIISPSNGVYYEACYRNADSCFILISYSGETPRIVSAAKRLSRKNVPTISITSFGSNTLASVCSCCLHISTRQKLISNLGNFSINLSVLYLLDVLYAGCFRLHYRENEAMKLRFTRETEHRVSDNPILREEP